MNEKKKQRKKEAYNNGFVEPEMKFKFEGLLIINEFESGFAWRKQEIRDKWMEMVCLPGLCNGLVFLVCLGERRRY